jgi:hypothetical protein
MKEGENDSGSVTEYKALGERIYVRLRLPLDFCRSLEMRQTGCLLGTSGADSLKARATLSSKHSTDLVKPHTPPIPEKI